MDHKQFFESVKTQDENQAIQKELAFAESEYRQRVERVREIMGEMDLDGLLVTFIPNVCYVSGYQTFATDRYACVIVPRNGELTLHVTQGELGGAFLGSWIRDIRPTDRLDPESEPGKQSNIWVDSGPTAAELADVLKEHGLESGRIGVDTKRPGLPIQIYEGLKRGLPEAELVDASEVVPRLRLVKSPAELQHMRQAAKATVKGMEAALAAVRSGGTDNDVAAAGYQALVANGSEYFSSHPIVSTGHRAGWPHTNFKRVPLKAGDTVNVELGCTYQRYTAGLMRAALVGNPSDTVRRLAEASNAALVTLFETVKPGLTAHEVAQVVTGILKKELGTLEPDVQWSGSYGYSIGLGFPPTWRETLTYVTEGIHHPLRPGMTFHSPIMLRMPNVLGLGFSETWTVTETGVEVFTKHERELHVVPA